MPKIDYLLKKLNIHGTHPGAVMGAGGEVELKIQDVFAALGYGDLTEEVYYIGLAVHRKDDYDINIANQLAAKISSDVFQKENWSTTSPFKVRVQGMVKKGALGQAEALSMMEDLGKQLVSDLGEMALYELMGPHTCECPDCSGTGLSNGGTARCRRCKGIRRVQERLTEKKRSERARIKYDSWKGSWKYRYQII